MTLMRWPIAWASLFQFPTCGAGRVWRNLALRAVQQMYRDGNFGRKTRWLVWKGAAGGFVYGVLMTFWGRGLPIYQRSLWLALIMWIIIGVSMFSLMGYLVLRFFRVGTRAMGKLHESGCCPFCAYDLRGSRGERCSECGKCPGEFASPL